MSRSFFVVGVTPDELRKLAARAEEEGDLWADSVWEWKGTHAEDQHGNIDPNQTETSIALPGDHATLYRLANEMDMVTAEAGALGISTEPYKIVAEFEDGSWTVAIEDADGNTYQEWAEVPA